MRRKCLSVVFSVVLALSMWGNSVYASGMESAGAPAVVVEAEESAEALTEDSGTEESVVASTEESDGPEESVEESTKTPTEEDNSQGEAADVSDVDDNNSNEFAEDKTGESVEAPVEGSAELGEPAKDESEPGESIEDGVGLEDPTEDNSEPGESTEESSGPEESVEVVAESEEDGESVPYEEIDEDYYASTSDGWSFTVNGSHATITGYTGKNTVLSIPATVRDSKTGTYYTVKAIGSSAFRYNKSIIAVTVPDSVTDIGGSAFEYCSNLKKVHLGSGVTKIGSSAFAASGITGIIFPESVSSLGAQVLSNCDNLGAIELDCNIWLPEGFASGCDNLTNVMLGDKVANYSGYNTYPFENTPMLMGVYVGNSSLHSIVFAGSGVGNDGGTLYGPDSSPLPSISKPRLQVVEDAESRGVLMTTDTPGAIIFYSTTGSSMNLETDWVASGNGVDFTFFKGTVYARTYLCGKWSDAVSINLPERKLAQPSFAVKGVFGGREVTFNTTQKGAVIYYSTKGSTDITTSSAKAENGQAVLFENFYGSVYAKTYYNGVWSNPSRLILKIPVVNDPTITYSGDKVTIRTTTPDAYIYYTTDGSTPSIHNGKRLSNSGGTFTLPSGTVKAIAVRSCFTNSNVVSKKITPVVDSSIKVPSFQVKGVIGGRTVTFNTAQKGAVIYYSSSSSTLTTADKKVNNGQSVTFEDFYGTIYARTYYNGKWSNVARFILKIPVVNQPTIRSNGGGYYTISTSTPSCTIYYTTDGSTPSPTNGRKINASSGKVYIGNYYRIRAIAVRSCFTNSPVATY